jgi:hypothetical protein
MTIDDFKKQVIFYNKQFFHEGRINFIEKRNIIFEGRITISESIFIEFYYNSFTGKKSYALICSNNRIFGYDNYKYWHVHPLNEIEKHIKCSEPSIENVFSEMKNIIDDLKQNLISTITG